MLPRKLNDGVARTPRGSLHHRVTILKQNAIRDDEGEYKMPTVIGEYWANVQLLRGQDLEKAQQVVAQVSHKVIIGFVDGITSDMLIDFEGRRFVIQAKQDPDEHKYELWLLCLERNDGQHGEQ
jgi:SPP1 family predicted phage head-tail adaptor